MPPKKSICITDNDIIAALSQDDEPVFAQPDNVPEHASEGEAQYELCQHSASTLAEALAEDIIFCFDENDMPEPIFASSPSTSTVLPETAEVPETESSTEDGDKQEEYGDIQAGRKRKKKGIPNSWDKNRNKKLRMAGKGYLGYRRPAGNKVFHDIEREERKMGPTCQSTFCRKAKRTRSCNVFSEESRRQIFDMFWEKLNWDQRKVFVINMIDVSDTVRMTKGDESRRQISRKYHLKLNDERKNICQTMFLQTLGIKEWTVRYWLENSTNGMTVSKEVSNSETIRLPKKDGEKAYLTSWLKDLPVLPSHYCRKQSTKLYLEPPIRSITKLYSEYVKKAKEDGNVSLSRKSFSDEFHKLNLGIFLPKKDQCDTCCAHTAGNVTDEVWNNHITKKNLARIAKDKDKKLAVEGKAHVYTMDLQAVKVAPYLQASALYYKTKLSVHNFTMYNLGNKDVTCYWFNESESDLVASTFVSCVMDQLTKDLDKNSLPVIIYSDGCTYQNRNVVMANALVQLAVDKNVTIQQKFLEKGHTQMECDSVHSAIECKLKNVDITLPGQYAAISKTARNPPYEVKYLEHSFFKNFADKRFLRYESIRPGRTVGDPVVTDLRVLIYSPNGVLTYKTSHDETLPLKMPRRPRHVDKVPYPPLHKERIKIPGKKWHHLQQLKSVLNADCHLFYDNIPYLPLISE